GRAARAPPGRESPAAARPPRPSRPPPRRPHPRLRGPATPTRPGPFAAARPSTPPRPPRPTPRLPAAARPGGHQAADGPRTAPAARPPGRALPPPPRSRPRRPGPGGGWPASVLWQRSTLFGAGGTAAARRSSPLWTEGDDERGTDGACPSRWTDPARIGAGTAQRMRAAAGRRREVGESQPWRPR